ncbi:MAG: hydroxymethylbilane synthase, partial [Ilumatobacteraceae bacterium]
LSQCGVESELVIVETHGDRTQAANTPLHEIGGQGVFTKEVQQAVLDGRADAAVHSAKDLPTERPHQLHIAAIMARRSPTDALIGRRLLDLEDGATVATGSVRRRAQIAEIRPDLNFLELRGNIETRLQKIPDSGSIVMAVSALEVLNLTSHIAEELDPAVFVPAVGQGAIAVECRNDSSEVLEALAGINDETTSTEVTIERAYLGELGAGCTAPVGAHVSEGVLTAFLGGDESNFRVSIELTGDLKRDIAAARALANEARITVGV